MGQSSIKFMDNENLIDSLVVEPSLLNSNEERAFRLVDIKFYSHSGAREALAIYDSPFRDGFIHISAPSIYVLALKHLNIQPGNHFLNVGSGTGYFSTVIGFLLEGKGINHGLEQLKESYDYSLKCLDSLKTESDSLFEREFSPPLFFNGNIFDIVPLAQLQVNDEQEYDEDYYNFMNSLDISSWFPDSEKIANEPSEPDSSQDITIRLKLRQWPELTSSWRRYDRIYVGAGISSPSQLHPILSLLTFPGIFVAPVKSSLIQITRVNENELTVRHISAVSFSGLVPPNHNSASVSVHPFSDSYQQSIMCQVTIPKLESLCARILLRVARRAVLKDHDNQLPVLGRHFKVEVDSESPQQSNQEKLTCQDEDEEEETSENNSSTDAASEQHEDMDEEEAEEVDDETVGKELVDESNWTFVPQNYFLRLEIENFLKEKLNLNRLIVSYIISLDCMN